MTWKALFGHLKTITRHHHMVMLGCFKVGLYRQGLLHDLSKLSPAEFIPGVKYYQGGKRSPTGAERRATGISKAWLHHKAHNKHHLEYWLDWTKEKPAVLHGMPIPKKYLAEMAVDRMSAAKVYLGKDYTDFSPLEYLTDPMRSNDLQFMHPDTGNTLKALYGILGREGEDAFYRAVRELIRTGKVKESGDA